MEERNDLQEALDVKLQEYVNEIFAKEEVGEEEIKAILNRVYTLGYGIGRQDERLTIIDTLQKEL